MPAIGATVIDRMAGLGFSASPTTWDEGSHRPSEQLILGIEEARYREARGLVAFHPPWEAGVGAARQMVRYSPTPRFPNATIHNPHRGFNLLGLTPPPGGSDVPAPPGGMPGTWIDDSNYKDAAGKLWSVTSTGAGFAATSTAYASGSNYVNNPTRAGLAAAIDNLVAGTGVSSYAANQTAVAAARMGFLVGGVVATLTIGTITAIVLLVQRARRPRARSNPRRRRAHRRR